MFLLVFILLISRNFVSIKTNTLYNKLTSIVPAPAATAYFSTASSSIQYSKPKKQLWPSTLSHNNWFILQPAKSNAVAVQAPKPENSFNKPQHQITKSMTSSLNNYAKYMATQQQQQSKQQHLPEQQKHSLRYYINDNSSGNYNLPSKDIRNIEPYSTILKVSKQRHPLTPSKISNNKDEEHHHANKSSSLAKSAEINQWATSNMRTFNNNQKLLNNEKINKNHYNQLLNKYNNFTENNIKTDTISNFVSQPYFDSKLFAFQDIKNTANNDDVDSDNGASEHIEKRKNFINSMKSESFNYTLMPLRNCLDNVKYFCEILKEIISDADEDLVNSDHIPTNHVEALSYKDTASSMSLQNNVDTTQLKAEVQGRQKILLPPIIKTVVKPKNTTVTASSSSLSSTNMNETNATITTTTTSSSKSLTSATLFIGRGKKLKKKLKKLMLPLLLAYKLKFIALVPLLIGGLTLLVGSTGLAGFFFALFVTVMTLKGGSIGSDGKKSIVIDKYL